MNREEILEEIKKAENDLAVIEKYGTRANLKDKKFIEGRINALKQILPEV